MQKKLFLQRNNRKGAGGGQSYLRYLVLAAVCLIFLVLVTPYLFKGKNKDITRRPMPDRGAVTKEVPRAAEPLQPMTSLDSSRNAEPSGAPEAATPEASTASVPVQPQSVLQPSPAPQEQPIAAAHPAQPAASSRPTQPAAVTAPEPEPGAEPAPKDLFPKKHAAHETLPVTAAVRPSAPAATTAITGETAATITAKGKSRSKTAASLNAPKPSASPTAAGKGNFAVQVGSTFKKKAEAEMLRRDLAKKGYSAVVRTTPKGTGFYVITGPCAQSKAYTLLEQMKIQGVSSTKVIKVAPVQKAAPKRPDVDVESGVIR